ncbi:hypothetical protein PLICRDRAFT_174675 [Plicaturopsis crispa FD-325 SS-3]|nr:hypothetical protein PLICRDRAFT_174675 [Plicaturopsis crispa FD-325 SS-3]
MSTPDSQRPRLPLRQHPEPREIGPSTISSESNQDVSRVPATYSPANNGPPVEEDTAADDTFISMDLDDSTVADEADYTMLDFATPEVPSLKTSDKTPASRFSFDPPVHRMRAASSSSSSSSGFGLPQLSEPSPFVTKAKARPAERAFVFSGPSYSRRFTPLRDTAQSDLSKNAIFSPRTSTPAQRPQMLSRPNDFPPDPLLQYPYEPLRTPAADRSSTSNGCHRTNSTARTLFDEADPWSAIGKLLNLEHVVPPPQSTSAFSLELLKMNNRKGVGYTCNNEKQNDTLPRFSDDLDLSGNEPLAFAHHSVDSDSTHYTSLLPALDISPRPPQQSSQAADGPEYTLTDIDNVTRKSPDTGSLDAFAAIRRFPLSPDAKNDPDKQGNGPVPSPSTNPANDDAELFAYARTKIDPHSTPSTQTNMPSRSPAWFEGPCLFFDQAVIDEDIE